MKINRSFTINPKPLAFLIFSFLGILTIINLFIGLNVLKDPSPFTTSYWDVRWAIIFGIAFLFFGGFSLLSKSKLLFMVSFIGLGFMLIIPLFTIGIGQTYLVLILLILIALGTGEKLLNVLLGQKLKESPENLAFSLLLGFGVIMILVMIQGFLNGFSALVTWLGIGVMSLLFVLPNLKRWFISLTELIKKINLTWGNEVQLSSLSLIFGIIVVLLIPSWLIALSPPMRYDEMTYHLTAPLLYLEQGGIVIYPEGGMTVWMHYAEMLYTLAIQTAGLTLPRIFHLFFGLMSVVFTYLFGRRLVNKQTGIIAALLLFSVPVVGYESATAYIDFFVTAYTTAVGFSLLLFWQEQNPRWLLVAGFLGGIGLGIKLTAGPMIAILIGVLILIALIKRFSMKNYLWIGAMILMIVALALPWLIRDKIWTGDPFYPYGTMFLQRLSQSSISDEPSQQINLINKLAKYVSYPIDISFNSNRYYHEAPGGIASVLPLLSIPLFLFSSQITKQVKKIALILLGSSIVTVWIMLLVNNALIRYAMPVFPWLAVCAAMNINTVSDYFSSQSGRVGRSLLLIIGLVYLFSTRLPLIVRLNDNLPQRLPVNYFLGRENKEEYLSRNLAVYDAYQFIDSQENGPQRVLSIGNEFRLYTKSRIDGIYDVAEAHQIVSSAENYEILANSLADAGYDYILINQPEIDFRVWKYSDPYPILQNGDFLDLYAKLIFVKNDIYVYQFYPSGVKLPEAVNLLLNPGFENLITDFDLDNWEEIGPIQMSENAFEGNRALQLFAPLSDQGQNYIYQKVAVVENQLYTLGYWVKSEDQAVFLMQIRWLDNQGNIIAIEEEWKNVSQEWGWISKFSQSPENANFAEIYASLGGSENALVDEICFAAGQQCTDP